SPFSFQHPAFDFVVGPGGFNQGEQHDRAPRRFSPPDPRQFGATNGHVERGDGISALLSRDRTGPVRRSAGRGLPNRADSVVRSFAALDPATGGRKRGPARNRAAADSGPDQY